MVKAVGKEMGFTNPFVTVSHHRAKRELLKLDEAFFKRQFKVFISVGVNQASWAFRILNTLLTVVLLSDLCESLERL